MKILCVFGEHNYGNPARGQGYEYSNFLPALRNLGHEVEFFDSFNRTRHADFIALNRALLTKFDAFIPDIVFCVLMGYEVWIETLQLMRDSGARLINWGTDDSWKYEQFSRYMAPVFDLWITTSSIAWKKAKRDGHDNFILSQWAARTDTLTEPLSANQCTYPVSFVGSAYGNRPRWISDLAKRGIEIACFGFGWPNGSVAADEIPRIVRESYVSLNFGDSGLHFQGIRPYRSRQIKARVFEVSGAGGCLMTESAENLEDYYNPGDEIVIFRNIDDLASKIHHLLKNPIHRDAIAHAAYLKTRTEHTYELRFNALLADVSQREQTLPIDFTAFEALAAHHRIGATPHRLSNIMAMPFQLFLGKQRGKRAARRLLFELSWRLLGKQVYTAAGWPGRLFYTES